MPGPLARLVSLWRGATRPRATRDAEMDEEFRLHMDLRADDLVRQGVPSVEARRRAQLEFGVPERYREAGRRARGLGPLDAFRLSALDVVLGWRMLR